jgi:lambda family phage portal protein
MSLFSKALALLGAPAVASATEGPRRPSAGYMRGNRSVAMASWRPALRETQDDISEAWNDAAARVIDLMQNSGWITGMLDQAVANTVGSGLRLFPRPENSLFGMSDADARAWGKVVAQRWETWSREPQECDIHGQRSHGQMQAAAFRSWIATGEILAELPYRRRPWNRYATKVRLLPPHRLSRKSDSIRRLVNGVYRDADGMPVGYRAERKDPILGTVEYDVAARDAQGRRRVIHIFDGPPETYRGISPVTPVLQVARQFDQLSDATLTQQIVKTLFAATITGDEPTAEVLEGLLTPQERARMFSEGGSPLEAYLDMVGGFYDGATMNLGVNGRISHLFPGQKLELHTASAPGSDYEAYANHLLREMSRCLGLTFESASLDYRGATYSSVRMGSGEMFAVTSMRRQFVVAPFCQATYEAWLEEEVANAGVPFPGGYEAFLANRVAACRTDWRGSPKPQADDLKTAKAHEIWKRLGVVSDEMIASDLGVDIEDVYAARAAEVELRKGYGLPEPELMSATGGAPGNPGGAAEDGEDEQDDAQAQ